MCGTCHMASTYATPKNNYNYNLLYEQLSPAKHSLFHSSFIFIAANDF